MTPESKLTNIGGYIAPAEQVESYRGAKIYKLSGDIFKYAYKFPNGTYGYANSIPNARLYIRAHVGRNEGQW